jgi:hypothetical protein
VLAFYRREMGKLDWKEDARGPVENGDGIVLNFAKPDTTAVLKLGYEYDLTTVSLVQQLPDRIAQERIKAQRDAEEKLRKRAEEYLRGPARVLAALKEPTGVPIPVPDVAEKLKFDSTRGDATFQADSTVKEITTFYRAALEAVRLQGNSDRRRRREDGVAALRARRKVALPFGLEVRRADRRAQLWAWAPGVRGRCARPGGDARVHFAPAARAGAA